MMLFAAPDSEFVANYLMTEVLLAVVGFVVFLFVALVAVVVIKASDFRDNLLNGRAEEKWGRIADELEEEDGMVGELPWPRPSTPAPASEEED